MPPAGADEPTPQPTPATDIQDTQDTHTVSGKNAHAQSPTVSSSSDQPPRTIDITTLSDQGYRSALIQRFAYPSTGSTISHVPQVPSSETGPSVHDTDMDRRDSHGARETVAAVAASDTADDCRSAGGMVGPRLGILEATNSLHHMYSMLMAKETSHADLQFYFRRLLRLVLHQAMEELEYQPHEVNTPSGTAFQGLTLSDPAVCAVTLMRGGIHLAHSVLRESIRTLSIGHILVGQTFAAADADPTALYAKLPVGCSDKCVFLVDFCIATGHELVTACRVLLGHGVRPDRIVIVSPLASEAGIVQIRAAFPHMRIHTGVVQQTWTDDFDIKRLES
eukprot:m.212536 g.212536  ORF g.212536 m.212536 type:complete len:336 (+) comp26156_c0_seq1:83-1090(+)